MFPPRSSHSGTVLYSVNKMYFMNISHIPSVCYLVWPKFWTCQQCLLFSFISVQSLNSILLTNNITTKMCQTVRERLPCQWPLLVVHSSSKAVIQQNNSGHYNKMNFEKIYKEVLHHNSGYKTTYTLFLSRKFLFSLMGVFQSVCVV